LAEAVALGERIRNEIVREKRTSKALEITVSVGVAVYPIHASDPTALVAHADSAMYRAKHDGRNLTRVGNDDSGPAPIIEVPAASKEASETVRGVSPEQPSSGPFKIPRMNDPELEKVSEHYRSLGREPVLPRMEARDVNLARGYELAMYPGTARE